MLLLSSLHKTGKTDEVSGKPEIIEYYNRTKGGTDCFDQLCSLYSCSRPTMRWPMRFFMGMLDQAAVNSSILYNFIPTNAIKNRREFLKELSLALVMPYLQERAQLPGLHRDVKYNISKIIGRSSNADVKNDKLQKRKRCEYCSIRVDRKVSWCCCECGKAVCEEHRRMICTECIS